MPALPPTAKLSPAEFGKRLIQTSDLDPVYCLLWVALNPAELLMSGIRLRRWLLAYWCFYHVGTASWIADTEGDGYQAEEQFWDRMQRAAESKDYPRSSERRHFRGQNAIQSVAYLRGRGLDSLWADFDRAAYEQRKLPLQDVLELVQEWVGFGPWIAFKVADMLERLGLVQVRFDAGAMFLFDSPKEGALRMWQEQPRLNRELTQLIHPEIRPQDINTWAVAMLLEQLGKLRAPPRYERPINVQEVETVLCKWNSYMKGSYHLGEDIGACRAGLLRFANCRTAQNLLSAGKAAGLW